MACAGRAAQYVGERFERTAPQTAARIQDYREERAYRRELGRQERAERLAEEQAQIRRLNEAHQRHQDRVSDERIADREYKAKYPDDYENYKRANRIEKMEKHTVEHDLYVREHERAANAAKARRDAKRAERSTSPFGYAEGFARFVYDEAKYTAGIDRHKASQYAPSRDPTHPRPGYNKRKNNNKKKGGSPPGFNGNIPGGP